MSRPFYWWSPNLKWDFFMQFDDSVESLVKREMHLQPQIVATRNVRKATMNYFLVGNDGNREDKQRKQWECKQITLYTLVAIDNGSVQESQTQILQSKILRIIKRSINYEKLINLYFKLYSSKG